MAAISPLVPERRWHTLWSRFFRPPCRVGVGEEARGIEVFAACSLGDHRREVGREVRLCDSALEDVLPWASLNNWFIPARAGNT